MHTDRISFEAVRTACWRDNRRLYRVFLHDGELLFLRVGTAAISPTQVHAPSGIETVAVALVVNAVSWWQREQLLVKDRALDDATDDDLLAIAAEADSFRIPVADLQDVAIRSRSFWLTLFYCPPDHAGILRFTHPTRGRMTFVFPTAHDMLTAFEVLRPLLGERLAVSVV
jgi:hypothetical protein